MLHARQVIPDQSSASVCPAFHQAVVERSGQPPQTGTWCLLVHTTWEKDDYISLPLFIYFAFADLDVACHQTSFSRTSFFCPSCLLQSLYFFTICNERNLNVLFTATPSKWPEVLKIWRDSSHSKRCIVSTLCWTWWSIFFNYFEGGDFNCCIHQLKRPSD